MNKLQRYEELMAAKLEQPPVPDMADAIWANIEKGLDADPPPGNGPSRPPSSPAPVSDLVKGLGLVVILAIVVVMFFVRKKNNAHAPAQPAGNAPVIVTAADSNSAATPFLPPGDNSNKQPNRKTGNIVTADSNLIHGQVINPVQNLDSTINPPLIIPQPVSMDSVHSAPPLGLPPPGKKPKGVRLSDSDYKIVPVKKD